MSTSQQPLVTDLLGPVDVVVFRVPSGGITKGWAALRDAQDQGQLVILDIDFVQKTAEGLRALDESEITGLGGGGLAGAHSGLLDEQDMLLAVDSLEIGDSAVVILKETLTFNRVVAAFGQEGSTLLAEETVLAEDLQASLTDGNGES